VDQPEVVLDFLRDRERAVTVGELADAVARERTDEPRPGADLSGDVHERLVEQTLPALDDAGHVRFDRERGIVSSSSGVRLRTRVLNRLRDVGSRF
jgi:DNA-binding transcriptional ArsR family regulator